MPRSAIDEMKSRLRKPYRAKRDTPRPGGTMEDPAPPWVAYVIDELTVMLGQVRIMEREATIVHALRWCATGDPRQRAEQLLTVLKYWPGHRDIAVVAFLEAAVDTGRGRRKGSKYHAARAVVIPEDWPPLPPVKVSARFVEDAPTRHACGPGDEESSR